MRRSAGALLGLAALGLGLPTLARAAPPIWRAEGAHAEVVMFGSVHLLSGATSWKTPELVQALARADQLWFEIPIDAAAQAQAGAEAVQLGTLAPGQTLSSLLPPALEARAVKLAVADGLPPTALERMKPWLAEVLLSTLYFQRQGADAALGVEPQIAAMAPPTASRQAFETVHEQLELLAEGSIPEQTASLKQTLDEIDDDPGLFGRLVADWTRGDTGAIVKEVIVPMQRDTPAEYSRLLVERNRRFASRIEAMLKERGRVVVVVGVGHLVGPQSVPALLRADGVAVQGP